MDGFSFLRFRATRRTLALLGLVLLAGCQVVQSPDEVGCFVVEDPYARPGSWYRGNFHMHSAHSDGALFPKQLVQLYREAGYGVLCISDHNSYGAQDGGIVVALQKDELIHDWNGDGVLHPEHRFGSGVEAVVRDWTQPLPPWSSDDWYRPVESTFESAPILLPGCEATHGDLHVGLVGYPPGPIEPPNTNFDDIERTSKAGGFVYLAHPAAWNDRPEQLTQRLDMRAFDGLEVVNGFMLARNDPGDATPLWDALLSTGYRLWGLANDDSHTWVGAPEAAPFTAYDVVLTDDASPSGFLAALHRGSFYGSTGLEFAHLDVSQGVLRVTVPEAERLRFVGRAGRVLLEVSAGTAEYVFDGSEGYVRVEAHGKLEDGKRPTPGAWSQPFFVRSTSCPPSSSLQLD